MITKNFIFSFEDTALFGGQVTEFLDQNSYSSVLVQVFSGLLEFTKLQELANHLKTTLPQETVTIGATTAGEILEGEMIEHEIVISVSLFENTRIKSAHLTEFDTFYDLGQKLAKQITSNETKAVILFADGLLVNGEEVTRGFSEHSPNHPVMAGGMAGDYSQFKATWLIHNQHVFNNGAVAVSLDSDTLRAFNTYNLSWTELGPRMTITKSDGARVYEIDHQPVIEVYRKFLGEDVIANMPDSTIEFPLIIQDQEIPVARSMIQLYEDNSIFFAGNLSVGSAVRIGVANPHALEKAKTAMRNTLAQQGAEACFIYSCIARKSFLGGQLSSELKPISEIAPVAGFFTYGEVYHFNDTASRCSVHDTLLNVTTTVLGLSEAEKPESTRQLKENTENEIHRQSLSYNALIHLVNQTTYELNNKLESNVQLIQLLDQYQIAINESFIVSKTDIDGRIIFANHRFEQVSGYCLDELIGKNHNIVRHPSSPESLFKDIWDSILNKQVWQGNITNRAKDGSTYIVKTSIIPILNLDGAITEFLSLREDITEQEYQRNAVEQEKAKVRSILDNQKSLVLMSNLIEGQIEEANQAFLNYTGFSSLDAFKQVHNCICDLFLPEEGFLQKTMHGQSWMDYALDHPEIEHQALIASSEGKHHIFSLSVSRLKDNPNYVIGNFTDITTLEKSRQRAVEAEHAQSAFLANMSHELRTPINGILGFADLLSSTPLDKNQERFVDILRSSSRHLLSVVNDILDISKIESGEIELNIQTERVMTDLEKILISFNPVAHDKHIEYIINLSPKLPEYLLYDNLRLHQVLSNLISNAIKFTPTNGKVSVDVEPIEITGNTATIQFSIKDSGIGIPKDKQKDIFENFKQASSSTTKEFGGTGLGLSIASKLVLQMGGETLEVESEENQGARFYFCLPLQTSQTETTISEAFKGLNVGLLCQDTLSPLSQMAINYLNELNIRVHTDSINDCKNRCLDGQCSYDVYLVLSTECFNGIIHTYDDSTLYIFFEPIPDVISIYENVVEIADFERNNSHLYNILLKYLFKHSEKAIIDDDRLFDQRILLAEDNDVNQMLMIELFKNLGVPVDIAHNGKEAVNLYQKNVYGLVIMDINMPVMSGDEALSELQRYAESINTPLCPIIALTANVMPEQVSSYKKQGFYGHLSKPLELKKLKKMLLEINSQGDNNTFSSESKLLTLPEFNLEIALSELGLPLNVYQMLINKTFTMLDQQLPEFERALSTLDYDTLFQISHNIYGSVSNLRIMPLAHLFQQIERLSKNQAPISSIHKLFDQVDEQVHNLKQNIEP